MQKNILVAQSGGPSAAINATLAGVVLEGMRHEEIGNIYGALNGIQGVIERRLIDLKSQIKTDRQFKMLECTPSMALGSCRHKLPDYEKSPAVYEEIRKIFHEYGIGCFFYVGGNDSMDTALKLSEYFLAVNEDIRVIGLPKTIDNDLFGTDHTPGYGSAAKFIATAVAEIARDCDAYNLNSVTIVEIMGRNAGWLTAASVLPRAAGTEVPQLVYMPEVEFSLEGFLEDVRRLHAVRHTVVIAVSEGIRFADGRYVSQSEQSDHVDAFGHRYLSGAGKLLERQVANKIGCKVRSVELNILQRCSSHILSATDINEARRIGQFAVRFALQGQTGVMAGLKRISDAPYICDVVTVPIREVAGLERGFPKEWIAPSGNNLTDDVFCYLLPLIVGDVQPPTRNGIPEFFSFNKSVLSHT
ncbi:6-phosphofructokinase [Acetanaerobacterium elongatum]|uniref:Pyrophosphate--fructose 6-phosphate 1-phosphotransferase n=1 Tax=Acetanaerobacterium elongatum TaxID=258515 RepID=A0A1H0AKQ5_9FIRM|nr:6-phosphofructokinase [Acetanaerobacterium elongatum]SDN34037.1 6-phosphofructokinase 1 [Acetanaerobacterium elongatum]